MKKPASETLAAYLEKTNLLELARAHVELISAHNHLIYRVQKDYREYALRMINPESYRKEEWISIPEEYAVLKAIEHTRLGPRVYALDEIHTPSFVIQDFVRATCFNNLKPLAEEYLIGAAHAIALLNMQNITPAILPFLDKYTYRGYHQRLMIWYARLLYACALTFPRRDVLRWALHITPLLRKTSSLLSRFSNLLPKNQWTFHFDGAHCGNTYWQNGKVIFLDWQRISLRNDPTFTLVRFATSTEEKGVVRDTTISILVRAYTAIRPFPHFAELAWARLLERQTSDLVWVLWDYARRRDQRPVEQATSVAERYAYLQSLLRSF
ncbi:MAG: hypothetical protein G01um101466_126 [Parcubacteria group bacterium Gr01-1014_66]|nr:MAG: hypothetical protein G01um101466_126 [Parcubacteria group bacterium Gr01-1014_66]